MTKLGAVIQVPFRTGNQFLGEGGIQVLRYHSQRRHVWTHSVLLGYLLRNPRQDTRYSGPAREFIQDDRQLYHRAPGEASHRNQGSYQGGFQRITGSGAADF